MSVIYTFSGQPKPGRFEDVLAMERLGARDQRLLLATVSSAMYGGIVASGEFEDLEAWGAFMDATLADEEIMAVMSQLQGENNPYLTHSLSVVAEIPVGRPRTPKGNYLWAYVMAPLPGRFGSAVESAGPAFEVLEHHGARNCRLWLQQPSGVQPEVLVATCEFDSLRSLGKTLTSFQADPAGQAITAEMQSSEAHSRPVTSDVFKDISDMA
jgi:hypothetical protein